MACMGRLRSSKCDAPHFECARQSMRGPRAMRFHASLGAAHGLGGFGNVQFLPVTHDKSFALTRRQLCNLLLNYFKYLSPLYLYAGGLLSIRAVGRLQGFERIVVILLRAAAAQRGKQRRPQRTDLLAAKV